MMGTFSNNTLNLRKFNQFNYAFFHDFLYFSENLLMVMEVVYRFL